MKANILRQHGIEAIELENGVVIASEDEKLTNVTDWTNDELYEWLGYSNFSSAFDKANSDYTKKMFSN